MNHLLIGAADKTERLLELAQPPFLLIDDGPIADAFLETFPKAKLFDITKHSFNPLRGMDYKQARDFAAALYTASPEGENTLTVRNGKRAMVKLLLDKPKSFNDMLQSSNDPGVGEAVATVSDLLLSPILSAVLDQPTNFSFKGSVVARIDRAAIGDFDAFVLACLLVGQHKGQIIVPDFGFYGRDFYMSLKRQDRLVVGLEFLSELSKPLQQLVLSIKDKTVYKTTPEDAERLKFYVGRPNATQITDLGEGEFHVSR